MTLLLYYGRLGPPETGDTGISLVYPDVHAQIKNNGMDVIAPCGFTWKEEEGGYSPIMGFRKSQPRYDIPDKMGYCGGTSTLSIIIK